MYTVGDLLKHLKQTTVFYISPEFSITDARDYMKEKSIGAVSVKSNDTLVGILTERDMLWKCELRDDLSQVKVETIMTPAKDIVSVTPGVDLEECFNLMDVHRVRHLPVVDDGELVGMLSIRDLVRAIVDQQIFISSQLENYITGRS
ncbi:MAG: CBS domain-containing protein [Chloroflexota bacterium]|nr:MAG: CBS domain-containing protein [Chloroflexota bacterium]